MTSDEDHVYRTPKGRVTVNNPVQRQILLELAHGDRQLEDLEQVTGKSKSALSGVHMKDLLREGLVTERPHPTDGRRKIFRLNAVPEAEGLRRAGAAVPHRDGGPAGFSVADVLVILAEAPDWIASDGLVDQARALGRRVVPVLDASDAATFAKALGRFAEDEGLATHRQLDFEALTFRCSPGPDLLGRMSPERAGTLLAALAEGMAEAAGLEGARFTSEPDGEAFRIEPA